MLDERTKHRIIGVIVVISVIMILAPVVLKTTEPTWHTLHRRGEFKIPKKPDALPRVIVKKPIKNFRVPDAIATVDLDKANHLTLQLKPVTLAAIGAHNQRIKDKSISKKARRKVAPTVVAHPSDGNNTTHYRVLLATFRVQKNAKKLQEKVSGMGLDAKVNEYVSPKQHTLYRVELVKRFSRDKATAIIKKMQQKLFVNGVIRRG